MSRLNAARTAFLVLWHEHETPTRTWRHSRHSKDRTPHGARARTVSVGVHADGQRHKRRGYRLDDITTALTELTTDPSAQQAARQPPRPQDREPGY